MDSKTNNLLQKFSKQRLQEIKLKSTPQQLLKNLEKQDSRFRQQEAKIEKAFLQYKNVWDSWNKFINEADDIVIDMAKEFGEIIKSLDKLGIDPRSVPELSKADQLLSSLRNVVMNSASLYQEPK